MRSEHDQIPEAALSWHREGRGATLATVVETWGSAPRPVGAQLAISGAASTQVVIDSDAVIIKPEIAEAQRPPEQDPRSTQPEATGTGGATTSSGGASGSGGVVDEERMPTRFQGTVMISADRPAKEIHQIVEAIVEQLTTLPGAEVNLKLEIDAEAPSGLDRAKVRTLLENAATLGFIDKKVE